MELIIENISHQYKGLRVLEGIDLSVPPSETLALIGPSGCGKSTLLSIAGGLLAPTSGKVKQVGEVPSGCLNPLTFVFQDFALLPWETVAGNVALALSPHGLAPGEIKERVDEVLARTGLSDFADVFPKQLSGGMRQRAGIARALAVRPAVLLMDEPLSALDAQTRELLMDDFLDLWLKERTTTIYVTHNLHEALRLSDRVAVMTRRPGRIKEMIPIGIPQHERTTTAGQAELALLHDRLWDLIREEARLADRELSSHGGGHA